MDEEPLYADGTFGYITCDICGNLFDVLQIKITYDGNFYCFECLKEHKYYKRKLKN